MTHFNYRHSSLPLSVAMLALLLVVQLCTPSFATHILTNVAMTTGVKALLAPGILNEGLLNDAREGLYQAIDTGDDPLNALLRLREIESSRWYLQSSKLKEQGQDWETVFTYQEWTRKQFDETILTQWKLTDPPDWYSLGRAAERIGLWSLAAHFYHRALTAVPSAGMSNESLLHLHNAQTLLRSGRTEQAKAELTGVAFLNSTDQAKADWLLAQALATQGRYSEAVRRIQAAAHEAPYLLETAEGAQIAALIEAHAPLTVPNELRSVWTAQISNVLENGGFEKGISGWGMWPELGANSTIDDQRAYSGLQSFRVQFDGSRDVNYYQVSQKVAVQPGQKYELSAQMWAENLTGDVALEVRSNDWFGGVTGPVMHGSSQGWQKVTHSFVTPENVNEVTVTIVRYGGNGLVSGTVWVDDIVMLPVPAE